MNIESHFDYDALRTVEDTREALRTLSVMTGALMERGEILQSYAIGFEVLLDTQVGRLKEAEDMIRASYRSIKQDSARVGTQDVHHAASELRGKLAPNSNVDADGLSTGLDGDLSEERQRTIEADLKLKAGTVQRVIDQLQAKRQDHSSEREAVA